MIDILPTLLLLLYAHNPPWNFMGSQDLGQEPPRYNQYVPMHPEGDRNIPNLPLSSIETPLRLPFWLVMAHSTTTLGNAAMAAPRLRLTENPPRTV